MRRAFRYGCPETTIASGKDRSASDKKMPDVLAQLCGHPARSDEFAAPCVPLAEENAGGVMMTRQNDGGQFE